MIAPEPELLLAIKLAVRVVGVSAAFPPDVADERRACLRLCRWVTRVLALPGVPEDGLAVFEVDVPVALETFVPEGPAEEPLDPVPLEAMPLEEEPDWF